MAEDHQPIEFIFDAWAPLSFKRALGNKRAPGVSWLAPTWTDTHARRLQAYKVLQSYLDNSSRYFLQLLDIDKMEEHREYGDASILRDRITDAVLGEEQHIITDGAEDFHDELPDDADEKVKKASGEAKPKHELQTWFEEWSDTVRFAQKRAAVEGDASGLGDGVYRITFNPKKKQIRLRTYDPGFYFPVLSDDDNDEYPRKVHLAWEIEDNNPDHTKVRRITYELRATDQMHSFKWNDEPTEDMCFLTDAIWTLSKSGGNTIEDFSGGSAEYQLDEEGNPIKDVPLEIDFIPIVHLPNTVETAVKEHFGQSSLSKVLQIIDDLANADTDLQKASATTGFPPIALGGATMGPQNPADDLSKWSDTERWFGARYAGRGAMQGGGMTYQPGQIFETGDGKLDILDTSKSLTALIDYVSHLLKRLSVNASTPEAVLGRVDPGKLPSGIALALSFNPMVSMVNKMRLVRAEKYPLIFKFVWRMATAAALKDTPAEYFHTELRFGSFLPQDQQAEVEKVTKLLTTKPAAVSLETAVAMLIEVGIPIEDAQEEVRRIKAQDFKGAIDLFDATANEDAVSAYLGVESMTAEQQEKERAAALEQIQAKANAAPDDEEDKGGGGGLPNPKGTDKKKPVPQ